MKFYPVVFSLFLLFLGCKDDEVDKGTTIEYPNVVATFGTTIDLNHLPNYANQAIPAYITKDNTANNPITDAGATLGRVLFYDKELSSNRTVSCATCHQQALAFSDSEVNSVGVNGITGRHSMRLINTRFSDEVKFFWDERASSLENQTTQPIQDHKEMGFSGTNGDGNLNDLIARLSAIGYYKELFKFVYGSETITEVKIQKALAQFIRSIQSFDAKYDVGRAQATNDLQNFSNFSNRENFGKELFLTSAFFDATGNRVSGGIGCIACHRAPEFDIDPNSLNNGVFYNVVTQNSDFTNTKSSTLRDIFNPQAGLNSKLMHTGLFNSVNEVLEHYDNMFPAENLDPRLMPNGNLQKLNLTDLEKTAVEDFLKTLSGTNVYTDVKWSDPF